VIVCSCEVFSTIHYKILENNGIVLNADFFGGTKLPVSTRDRRTRKQIRLAVHDGAQETPC